MHSSVEGAKQDPLHWWCRPVDGKQKLNLGDVYKASAMLADEGGDASASRTSPLPALRSCADDHRKGLACERKGPYAFQLYTPLQQEARCLALDVFFEEPAAVAEIRFRNHYVADLSVLMKFAGCREWEATVPRLQLMPHPHFEGGARDHFAVAPQMPPYGACWPEVSEIRLVLRQPSANWRRFYVENVTVYGERGGPEVRHSTYLAHLAQKTTEALRMERKNERRASSAIPFHIGTHGYEIDKLHKF